MYIDPCRENGVVTPYGGVIYAFDKRRSGYASVSDVLQPQNQRTAHGALQESSVGGGVNFPTPGAPAWGNFHGEPRKAQLTLRAVLNETPMPKDAMAPSAAQ